MRNRVYLLSILIILLVLIIPSESLAYVNTWPQNNDYFNSLIVAVIDDGIDFNKVEFNNNIWINKKEIDGNGIDDDHNGYIDDTNGWNFIVKRNYSHYYGSHGTKVAGIIIDAGNNKGNYPNVSLMSLIVVDSNGTIYKNNIINAIKYAVDNGADIINISLAGSFGYYSPDFDEIIKYAFDRNVFIIVAAGNAENINESGANLSINKVSPVCNDLDGNMVFGVGALNKRGRIASWSNTGRCVDVFVQGEDIRAISLGLHSYSLVTGTSFAAPIVTRAAVNLRANNKAYSVEDMNQMLKNLFVIDGNINNYQRSITEMDSNNGSIYHFPIINQQKKIGIIYNFSRAVARPSNKSIIK